MIAGREAPTTAPLARAPESTRMFREAAESAECVHLQLERNRAIVESLAARLRARPPRALATCARGSSDHAATFMRYLAEMRLKLLTSSLSPSVSSVYGIRQDLRDCLLLAYSQSGRSPDLLAAVDSAARAGAMVVAVVNEPESPLAEAAQHVLPLYASPETSVAATKSYVAMLAASLQLVAAWARDAALEQALESLPALLERAWTLDWSAALAPLAAAEHLLVVGRGPGLAIAQEAALKLKETCGLHAEAFSGAELRHGPMALVGRQVPVLILTQPDETRAGLEALAEDLLRRGVPVLLAGPPCAGVLHLPLPEAGAAVQPLATAVAFYRLANALALRRGHDPDAPPLLRKVTETH